jgi:hypothetical protein
MECIICVECDLDISTLENICNFSYHWVVVSESDLLWGLECVSLCDGGKVSF